MMAEGFRWRRLKHTLHGLSLRRASLVAQMVKRLPEMWETRCHPWVRKIPWRRKWQPTPVLLLGKFHGLRSLVGYSPRGCKEQDMTSLSLLTFFSLQNPSLGDGEQGGRHSSMANACRSRTKDKNINAACRNFQNQNILFSL